MKNLKNITNFFFANAEYLVSDENGNSLIMKINYKAGKYNLVVMKKTSADVNNLKKEAKKIALDLLKRKSKVNFAEKY